ncbi:OLC1v1020066C1 [Oldenlandia corymbosa var. corymbosa]|uniref:OLC1v1020066C1 n=1 Tax=Oldenlandia corymbosa var. corymbosa TaxID=529605 RepID=A0AAV1EFK8_OLDCO|nr:OLC1v1020066C1 [Oldenlandia corymbosa var. corymbosa]
MPPSHPIHQSLHLHNHKDQLDQQVLSQNDLLALQQIKNSLRDVIIRPGSAARFFESWDFSSQDPCSTFAGITCSSPLTLIPRRVTSLILGTGLSDSRGLAGTLSSAISSLTELNQLVLNPGIVTGNIPFQLGSLRNLRVISLTNNRLTGPIPASIFALQNLHTLDLSNNQLSGSILPSISNMVELRVLVLSSNRLTGQIPASLPTNLLHLDLKANGFSGTLPEEMPPSLRYLSASGNSLWGPLNGLESLSELVYLDLSVNRFSGPIPESLFRSSPTLSSILLQRNNFSGGVQQRSSTSMASPSSSYGVGSTVDLSHNMLTGGLPAGNLFGGVETLLLNNNRFTGEVPREYIENVVSGRTKTLYLQHNYLSEFPNISWSDLKLPDSASLCLSYNCMVPPPPFVGLTACPASAGRQLSRPAYQCSPTG